LIKNVVFDLGGVLLEYEPKRFLLSFGFNPETMQELKNKIFDHPIWLELDRGTYTFKEAEDIIAGNAPELETEIRRVFSDEKRSLLFGEKHETVAFMRQLKKNGYKIYFLSNFSHEGFKYVESVYGFLNESDGRIISSSIGMIKPERGIYEALINNYGLIPEETVFIDDLEQNIKAAVEMNIKGIHFTEINEVMKKFKILEDAQ